jgi:integrase
MSHPLTLIVKKGKVRKDGTSIIFLQYCHSEKSRPLFNTGVAIPPNYWNRKSRKISENLPPEYGEVRELQNILTRKYRKVEDMITVAQKRKICPVNFVQTNFPLADNWQIEHLQEKKDLLDVYHNIDLYVDEKRSEVKPPTINVINMMKIHLKSFEEYQGLPITFDSFDFTFYVDFIKFLTYEYPLARKKIVTKGLKVNSIGKTVKWLKSFLKNRAAKKIIPPIDLSAFKVMEEDVDAIYLSWAEISAMYKLDLAAQPMLEKVRDEFVLGCLTGFRFSDYSEVKPDEIRDGMLYVKQTKTADRVVVPLRPDTIAILEKYNMEMPPVNNVEFNYYIKEVAKLANINDPVKFSYKRGNAMVEETRPKYAWVMSHTCRRSFCTNEFLDGTPVTLIMAISGHKTEKAFRKYIKADNLQKALMIKKLWANRPGL